MRSNGGPPSPAQAVLKAAGKAGGEPLVQGRVAAAQRQDPARRDAGQRRVVLVFVEAGAVGRDAERGTGMR